MAEEKDKNESQDILYKKLKSDGSLDPRSLTQKDYDLTTNFIKTTFPAATKVHKEMDESLKRVFVLGKSKDKKKKEKKSLGMKRVSKKPQKSIKKKKMSKSERVSAKKVPRKLLYSDFLPLHDLWRGYIDETFSFVKGIQNETKRNSEFQDKLNRIDLHGCKIRLTAAHCQSYLFLEGIVIKETKNTFVIVTEEDQSKVIPKSENTFEVNVVNSEGISLGLLKIAGNSFATRPAERSSKKIKGFLDHVSPKLYRKQLLQIF